MASNPELIFTGLLIFISLQLTLSVSGKDLFHINVGQKIGIC